MGLEQRSVDCLKTVSFLIMSRLPVHHPILVPGARIFEKEPA